MCHRFARVLVEPLLRPPLGVGILLPAFSPGARALATAGPLPGCSAWALCRMCVLRRFMVQPAGPMR